MQPPFDASEASTGRRDVLRDSLFGPGSLDRLDRARARLVRWRAALEADGFRTNLSLIPPCSIAARRVEGGDDAWVTVLPTGLIAFERRELGETASTWSRANELGDPSIDDVLETVRALFAGATVEARSSGPARPKGTPTQPADAS
jgi:hypothetical protein